MRNERRCVCFICSTRVAGAFTLKSRRTPNPSFNFICISHSVMKLEEGKKKKSRTGFNLIRETARGIKKPSVSRLNANDYLAN